jgi:hypothetical protein
MHKIHTARKILLRLTPLDAALVEYLSGVTGRKASTVLREGLRALAGRLPTFNAQVFQRYVEKEHLPRLAGKAGAERLSEDLAMFLRGEMFTESVPGETRDDLEFNSAKDFK